MLKRTQNIINGASIICVVTTAIHLPLIDEFNIINMFLIPETFFICGLLSTFYIYRLRNKRDKDME